MGFVIPAAILAAKLGKSYFANKAKKKQNDTNRKAEVSAYTIAQKQKEDARRARVDAAGSLLNSVPKTTAGGGVNTGAGIDPELLKRLGAERTYDFASAVPDANAGAGSAFLSGLFGGVGDTLGGMYGKGSNGADMSSGLYNATEAFNSPGDAYHGGMPKSAPLTMMGAGGGEGSSMTMEDLMKLINSGQAGGG